MTDPVAIGDVVAEKYVVQGVLGRGGIGVVFAAEHVTLRRRVALKFLRPELAGVPEVVQRFLREGRAAAQLQSEHVARVLDADTTASGAPYIVMELLEGRDLKTVLNDEGALPVEAAVDYVLQACEAVAEAHAIGILHRDLKSDNLFVTRSPHGLPLVKVLDFGLSKIETAGAEAGLTSDNHVMGAPHFMSPEQMRSSRDVDARSDLWALGVVLYTLIAGRVPFGGTYLTEVCSAVLSGDVQPLASVRPDLPPGLGEVIARCLRLEREERYASASELAAALAPFAGPGGAAHVARIVRLVAERAARAERAERAERKGADSSTSMSVVADAPAPPEVVASAPLLLHAGPAGRGALRGLGVALAIGLLAGAAAFAAVHRPPSAIPSVVTASAPLAPPAEPSPIAPPSVSSEPSASTSPAASASSRPAGNGARASATPPPVAPHPRVRPRRTQSEEDVILKLPH